VAQKEVQIFKLAKLYPITNISFNPTHENLALASIADAENELYI